MNGWFYLGLATGAVLAAAVIFGLGSLARSRQVDDIEDKIEVERKKARERMDADIAELGLQDLFPLGYDLVEPLYQLKEARERIRALESMIESSQIAAEVDARRLALAIERRLRNGWPFDESTLYALTAYKKRVGTKDSDKSPRLN